MKKFISSKKLISMVAVLSILVCSLGVFGISANAASDRVKLYAADRYFSRYGISGTYIYVQTKDNAFKQSVTVHFNRLNGMAWEDAKAEYFTTMSDGSKIWKAYISSYNTEYAIKYNADGKTYWDNNDGKNYKDEVIGTAPIKATRTISYGNTYNISATLKNLAYNKDVVVRYTENNWKTYKDAKLSYTSTNNDGTEVWDARLTVNGSDLKNFKYCLSYTANGKTYWDNNFGENYDYTYILHR